MNITVYQRNDLLIKVGVVDPDGDPVDLEGKAITFYVGVGRIVKTLDDGITVTDAEAGECAVALTSEDTDIPAGDYGLELLVVDPEDRRYTALTGTLTIERSIVP